MLSVPTAAGDDELTDAPAAAPSSAFQMERGTPPPPGRAHSFQGSRRTPASRSFPTSRDSSWTPEPSACCLPCGERFLLESSPLFPFTLIPMAAFTCPHCGIMLSDVLIEPRPSSPDSSSDHLIYRCKFCLELLDTPDLGNVDEILRQSHRQDITRCAIFWLVVIAIVATWHWLIH